VNCSEIRSSVYVYLDGEFAAPEIESYDAHLDTCDDCRSYVHREAAFLEGVRESLEAPQAPAALRQRIEATLAVTPLPEGALTQRARGDGRRWLAAAGLPAAAAVALVIFILLPGPPADAEVDQAIKHAVTAHHRELPTEIEGPSERVRDYLQRSVSFAVEAPLPESPGVKLIGARLTQVRGEPAVVYQYRVGARRLSVLQTMHRTRRHRPPRSEQGSIKRRVHHHQGYAVVTYENRGVTHAAVSSMPDTELMALVPASYPVY